VERWNGGTVERWNGGTVERWNGGTVERWNGGTPKAATAGGAPQLISSAVHPFIRPSVHPFIRSTAPPLDRSTRDPHKLKVVPAARQLAVAVYRSTRAFPREERFGLTAQIRRSAISIGSNIVEGCHRQGNRAFLAFLYQALGSAAELEFQLGIAVELQFAEASALDAVQDLANKVKRMLINLIASLRTKGD
jgi:four helix bundle protein